MRYLLLLGVVLACGCAGPVREYQATVEKVVPLRIDRDLLLLSDGSRAEAKPGKRPGSVVTVRRWQNAKGVERSDVVD